MVISTQDDKERERKETTQHTKARHMETNEGGRADEEEHKKNEEKHVTEQNKQEEHKCKANNPIRHNDKRTKP